MTRDLLRSVHRHTASLAAALAVSAAVGTSGWAAVALVGSMAPPARGIAPGSSSSPPAAREPAKQRESIVVVYTALDQVFSEKVLQKFEQTTGIQVREAYDTEATKTVGLVNRIIAEQSNPRCDVFWNNEIVRTIMLERMGLLEPYVSPSASDIPSEMKDSEGYWTGFAARVRVLIYNTRRTKKEDLPSSILELADPRWRGSVALAYPLFGTTATHAAALFTVLGPDKARAYYRGLHDNGVVIVDGNAASKDLAVRGEVELGFTDSDDAQIALAQGKSVQFFFPDQGENQMGTLVIPNTVALIKNCPHRQAGEALIDYLLSRDTEGALAFCGSAQIPVRAGIPTPDGVPNLRSIKAMRVDWRAVERQLGDVAAFMSSLFVR